MIIINLKLNVLCLYLFCCNYCDHYFVICTCGVYFLSIGQVTTMGTNSQIVILNILVLARKSKLFVATQ